MKIIDKDGFGERLKKAFGYATNTEIAAKIGSSSSAITNYIKGRIPEVDLLDVIAHSTLCSLHWLLTGEGSQYVDLPIPPIPLTNEERQLVEQIAQNDNQSFEQALHTLVIESLISRGLMKVKTTPTMLILRQDIKLVAIPLIGSLSAGQPISYFKEQKQVMVADIFLKEGYRSFALQIVGNDYADEGFADGEYIICCDNTQPQPGEVVIASINGGPPIIKRIFFEGPKTRLQPANGKSPGDLHPSGGVEILYTVTGVLTNP